MRPELLGEEEAPSSLEALCREWAKSEQRGEYGASPQARPPLTWAGHKAARPPGVGAVSRPGLDNDGAVVAAASLGKGATAAADSASNPSVCTSRAKR